MSDPASPLPVRSIALLSAAAFASAATLRVADPLLPQVAEEFGASVADASVVATGFALSYGLCQMLYGPLGDMLGKYRIITLMTLLSGLATGAAALSGSLSTLGLLRLLGGATAAALIPLSMAHIGDIVAYEDRQAVLARFMSGQILGVITGQAAGGVFGEYVGWRGMFVALAAAYVTIGLLLSLELRSGRVVQRRQAVSPGALLTVYHGLARTPRVRLVVGTVFLEGLLFFGGFTYLGAFLRQDYGLGYAAIGGLLACFGFGALAYTTSAPRFVARLGQRNMVLTGGAALALAFVTLAFTPPLWAFVPAIALCGLGFYLFHNTLQTQATQMAPEARGIAVTLFASGLFLGQATGVALGGLAAATVGYGPVFVTAGALLLALATAFRHRLTAP